MWREDGVEESSGALLLGVDDDPSFRNYYYHLPYLSGQNNLPKTTKNHPNPAIMTQTPKKPPTTHSSPKTTINHHKPPKKKTKCTQNHITTTDWFPASEATKRQPLLSTQMDEATGTVSKYFSRISVTWWMEGWMDGWMDG